MQVLSCAERELHGPVAILLLASNCGGADRRGHVLRRTCVVQGTASSAARQLGP
jgi:hypothetical protein